MIQCLRLDKDLYEEMLNALGEVLTDEERLLTQDKPRKWFLNTRIIVSFNFWLLLILSSIKLMH